MRGFTDKALILCIDPDLYDNKPEEYKLRYNRALKNLVKYCNDNLMQPCVLFSDEVAVTNMWMETTVLSTMTAGDRFFISRHNKAYESILSQVNVDNTYKDVIQKASKKFEFAENPTDDQRFDVIVKREHLVSKHIIDDFKLVFNIQVKNKMQYHAHTKENDGRIIVNFNAATFVGTAELSGKEISINDALNYAGANRCLFNWED